MCCSIGRKPVVFSGTQIYVGEATREDQLVHVLAYQNTATSLDASPNAMILPFPTNQEMTQENCIDTSNFKSFLKNISDATKIESYAMNARSSKLLGSARRSAPITFQSGSYTVILAQEAKHVASALKDLPEEKRPDISKDFLKAYGKIYPDQPVALCVWSGTVKAEPLLWWYVPANEDKLFIPTLDAHDGNPPNTDIDVATNHVISVGSTTHTSGSPVYYSDDKTIPSSIKSLLPTHTHGYRPAGMSPNADTFVEVSELRQAKVNKLPISRGKYTVPMEGWK